MDKVKPKKALYAILAIIIIPNALFSAVINVNQGQTGRIYEGIGAISASGNARLLVDYPEPYRSDILDFLFKPKFGASLQHFKTEIGGSTSSGCGVEPSHAITESELNSPVSRGYGFWLMKEARNRNPEIILDCLAWALPYWLEGTECSNCFCCPNQDLADYLIAFLETARDQHGIELDWIGGNINEKDPFDHNRDWQPWLNWVTGTFRPSLDAAGFENIKIQAPEGAWSHWHIFDHFNYPQLNEVIDAVGYHYIDQRDAYPSTSDIATGKPLWASEDGVGTGKWSSAVDIVRRMNKMYIDGKITKMEVWCLIDSCPEGVLWGGVGIMQAESPWSGHYSTRPAAWGVAHYTQFAQPGWVYLENGCGNLSGEGNFVTLKHPDSYNWSTIIYCDQQEDITFDIADDLSAGTVYVWASNESQQFRMIEQKTLTTGCFTLNCQSGTIYSVTTTTGQQKGQPAHGIPAKEDLQLPYRDDFESCIIGTTPKYITDTQGTFEVAQCKGDRSGKCLEQILEEKGDYTWEYTDHEPTATMTIIPGPMDWQDYELSCDVFIENGEIYASVRKGQTQRDCGYAFVLTKSGQWRMNFDDTQDESIILDKGDIEDFDSGKWHNIKVRCVENRIDAFVDGVKVCTITDDRRLKGQPCFGGSFDLNQFDNISVKEAGKQWTTVNQTTPMSQWYGYWNFFANDNFLNGNCYYSGAPNAYLTLSFWGTSACVLGTRRYDCGYMDVYVDNEYKTSVDCYSPEWLNTETLYKTDSLALGNHTMKIVVKGEKNPNSTNDYIIVEGFSYTQSPECREPVENMALSATASASSFWSSGYNPQYAIDGDYNTRWNCDSGDLNNAWLELDFGNEVTLASLRFVQFGTRINEYKIQYFDEVWKDVVSSAATSSSVMHVFEPVTSNKIRLLIEQAYNSPGIYEFEVFETAGDSDIDRNGVVDFDDLIKLCIQWMQSGCLDKCDCFGADLYHDGTIDYFDFSIMADMLQ